MLESNQQLIFVRDVRYHFANRAFVNRASVNRLAVRAPSPGAAASPAAAGIEVPRQGNKKAPKPLPGFGAVGLSRSASDYSSSPGFVRPAIALRGGSATDLCGRGGRLKLGGVADHWLLLAYFVRVGGRSVSISSARPRVKRKL